MQFYGDTLYEWNHTGNAPGMVFCSANETRVRLSGYVQNDSGSPQRTTPEAKIRRVNNQVEWQIPSGDGTWKNSEFPPPGIAFDSAWIVHVSLLSPDLEWLVGLDRPSRYSLGGMSWKGTRVLWMKSVEKKGNS